jgi:hypothetical protein
MASKSTVADIQQRYPGLWVAVVHGQVIDARDNPHALAVALHDHGVADATIFRCPAVDEPELVGLG